MMIKIKMRIVLGLLATFCMMIKYNSLSLHLQEDRASIDAHVGPGPGTVIDNSFRIVERTTQRKRKPKPVKDQDLLVEEQPPHAHPQVKTPVRTPSSPYAYTFVIGGIHENRPAYKGFVYDILVSANLLRKLGSTCDIWVWAQLSANSTLQDLLAEDKRMFQALNIHVELLEKPEHDSFAHIVCQFSEVFGERVTLVFRGKSRFVRYFVCNANGIAG